MNINGQEYWVIDFKKEFTFEMLEIAIEFLQSNKVDIVGILAMSLWSEGEKEFSLESYQKRYSEFKKLPISAIENVGEIIQNFTVSLQNLTQKSFQTYSDG